ncbi:T9SS type A sorting domain-containing protein [candidate division KSB1 bacterium]
MYVRKFSTVCFITVLALLLLISAAFAQMDADQIISNFKWREIGPANCGGRITDIEGVDSKPTTIYVGAATGGLWKTVNNGITWEPIFDDQPVASIGDIGLSKSNPDILYVGTGESNNRNSSPYGAGVYKSTDGGETWSFLGLKETNHIGRIIVHPTNPDIVYVAALGHLWGTNEDRGVFKSTNGGRTWDKVLYLDERTGVTDLDMDPRDPNILYAAAHERLRDRFDAGDPVDQWGPKAGIYVSKDGGRNWTKSTRGLPANELGRTALSASRSRPGVVYAMISTDKPPRSGRQSTGVSVGEDLDLEVGGVFKSTDYGESWQHMNIHNNRPSYYSQIRVDPNNHDIIWMCGSPLAYSDDGGHTVKFGSTVHGRTHIDYHAIWVDPNNSDHVLVGGDGGINITYDSGKKWDVITSIGLAQFYAISADMRKPYYVMGGLQDNGTWVGPSRARMNAGIVNDDWFPLSNADGFFVVPDPTDFNTIYYDTQGGSARRHDLRTGQGVGIRPTPPRPAQGEERIRYRFDWNTPIVISPHNPYTIYIGGNFLFRSLDRGDNWTAISPDLTAQINERNSAIVSIDESSLKAGLIWVGTNDGNVYMTENGGGNWTLLNNNIPGAPREYWVKRVEASHHEPGRAYVVFDGHRHDDQNPYVFMTDDFGITWKNITNDLPDGSVYVVREDYVNPDLLFAGTEFALFISLDRGETWNRFMNDFPTVPVHDLYIHPRENDLIAGTHGRGAWIVDNITPLQQLSAEVLEKDVHLFDVRAEVRWATTYEWGWVTDKRFYKPNPPTGSTIAYYLKNAVSDSVEIEISDIQGNVIRNLKGSNGAGMQKVLWDFRRNMPQSPNQAARGGQMRYRRRAPMVEPGTYLLKLKAGDLELTTKVVVEKDNPGYMGR